jgi:hypothetical protein
MPAAHARAYVLVSKLDELEGPLIRTCNCYRPFLLRTIAVKTLLRQHLTEGLVARP